jgi:flagella basal body P-ring formation protein FlgA
LTAKQVALLSAALSARVEIAGGGEPWVGWLPLRAGFYDRQGHRQEFQIKCRVKPLPQVLVPTANLPKGHVVRAEDVTWKQQPPTTAKTSFLDQPELVVGQETKRVLRAGEPIAPIDVRGVPLVRRGDIVTVVARNRGIVVRTDARALADGGLGQLIKLVSLDGRRELSARVSGFHEASVPPPEGNEPVANESGTGVRLVASQPRSTQTAPSRRVVPGVDSAAVNRTAQMVNAAHAETMTPRGR